MKENKRAAFNAAFASTDPADPCAVVTVTVGDVQQVSQQTINRDLSGVELMQVQAIIKAGLDNPTETIQDAICKVLDICKVAETIQGGICDSLAERRVPGTERRSIKTMQDMSVRREALIMFYGRVIGRFDDDPFERLLFIQCFAALDASEGHCLAGIYTEDFNKALTRYQAEKEHDVD